MIRDLSEVVKYRQLLYYFTWRDLRVRYKQTAIGILWVVLQPIALVAIFSLFLSQVGRFSPSGVAYPIFVFAGLVFWNYFASIINAASNSIITNGSVLKKVYFPRLIPPLSTVAVAFVDFTMSFLVFLMMFLVFDSPLNILGFIMLPVLILVATAAAAGLGLLFAAINVKYRDVKHALPFIIQAVFFLTPVIYPLSAVPQQWQWVLFLNPMTGVVHTAKTSFFEGTIGNPSLLIISTLISLFLLFVGFRYFMKSESKFVDMV